MGVALLPCTYSARAVHCAVEPKSMQAVIREAMCATIQKAVAVRRGGNTNGRFIDGRFIDSG